MSYTSLPLFSCLYVLCQNKGEGKEEGKENDYSLLRVFLGMCHQLGTEVTDGKEVVCPFNQLSVLLIEDWQAVETHTQQMKVK